MPSFDICAAWKTTRYAFPHVNFRICFLLLLIQYGLYTSFIGPFIYLVFGMSKDVALGPSAIASLMTLVYGKPLFGRDPTVAIWLALYTGIVQLIMYFVGFGAFLQFCTTLWLYPMYLYTVFTRWDRHADAAPLCSHGIMRGSCLHLPHTVQHHLHMGMRSVSTYYGVIIERLTNDQSWKAAVQRCLYTLYSVDWRHQNDADRGRCQQRLNKVAPTTKPLTT